jgi:hypothetical protein
MKTTHVIYDPAIWKSGRADLSSPWADYLRSRGTPLYSETELAKLDAKGALNGLSDADRATLFREAREAQ